MALITTWDDIRKATLHKLFLATGNTVQESDSTREYLAAMPSEYNAAVVLLATTNRYITKYLDVISTDNAETLAIDLDFEIEDLFQLKPNEIYHIDDGGNYRKHTSFEVISDNVLVIKGAEKGTYRIYYYAYPMRVTVDTTGDTDMQLEPDVAALIPLYMASQLYKDDDIGIATQYRNEFEIGREALVRERNKSTVSQFKSITKWW